MRKLAALALTAFLLLVPHFSLAAFSAEDSGLDKTAEGPYGITNAEQGDIAVFIGQRIIQPVLGLLGLLFFVLVVYAGFLWMTSAGEEKKVSKAKEILRTAVIGAVIIMAAYAITNAVFSALETGSISG